MNMRKIIAVLAAVLMLCAMIPMGAMSVTAAPGDVIVDWNFDDGVAHLERGTVEDGYLVFDASTGDWQNCYAYVNGFQTGVDYVVTFKAKADRATNLNFKVNDNWGADAAAFTVDVTTEWQEFEGTINMASLTSAIVMFSSNTYAASGATYYIDDVKIVEYEEPAVPGEIVNGDFETGSEGWTLNASASVVDGALQLDNPGAWSEAAMAEFAVEVGTEYTLSWKSQRVSGTGAFLMFVLKGDNSNHTITGTNWMNSTSTEWVESSITFVAEEANLKLKISPEVADAGIILIDDIVLTEKVYGQVINGDFSNGSEGWSLSGYASVVDGAVQLDNPTQYNEALSQIVDVEPNTNYEITWKSKRISGTGAFNLYVIQSVSPWGNFTKVAGQNWMNETSGEWVDNSYTVNSGDNAAMLLKFSTEGTAPGVILLDDIVVTKVVEASNDGFLKNGDFETGKAEPEWTVYSGTAVSADAAKNGSYGLHITNPTGGWGGTAYQDFTVEVGKTYEVTMWAKNLDGARGQNIQIQNPIGTNVASKWFDNTTSWTQVTFQFTATSADVRINICGGGTNANEELYLDDVKVVELIDPSFDGYIYNGDFETGELHPWNNLWGSNTVTFVEGYESNYAMSMVVPADKTWCQVRQDGIAVEAGSVYRLSAYVKNAENMSFVIKTGDDDYDLTSHSDCIFPAGDEWQLVTLDIDTGITTSAKNETIPYAIESICILVINYEAGGSVIIDNITMEKLGCEDGYHKYFYACDKYCMECGEETNPDADHHIEHVEAKAAVSCVEFGNKEYWYCTDCGTAWLDANLIRQTNMMSVRIAGECVSDAEFPCQDGECVNCGLPCYAEAEHEYDNDYDADCNVCGEVREVEVPEIVYGDADGDGEITTMDVIVLQQYTSGWEVELDEASADADGDGEITTMDVIIMQQYTSGWEVVLGPQG